MTLSTLDSICYFINYYFINSLINLSSLLRLFFLLLGLSRNFYLRQFAENSAPLDDMRDELSTLGIVVWDLMNAVQFPKYEVSICSLIDDSDISPAQRKGCIPRYTLEGLFQSKLAIHHSEIHHEGLTVEEARTWVVISSDGNSNFTLDHLSNRGEFFLSKEHSCPRQHGGNSLLERKSVNSMIRDCHEMISRVSSESGSSFSAL